MATASDARIVGQATLSGVPASALVGAERQERRRQRARDVAAQKRSDDAYLVPIGRAEQRLRGFVDE
jgi:hypothetical protein